MGLGFNIPLSADPAQLRADLEAAKTITKNAGSAMADAVGSLTAKQKYLSKALEDQLTKVSSLARKYGENNVQTLKAAAAAEELKNKLNSVATIAPNVGIGAMKSASGVSGLNYSVAQLTREMPAFSNSMQTGFMALSNNIPIFVDQIRMLKAANVELAAAGQPVKSVFGQIAGAFLSWNTVLSVGVTLATVYGAEIVKWVASLASANAEINKAAQNQEAFGVAIKNSTKDIQDQVQSLRERNRNLGVELAAKQQGVSVDKVQLNIERSRLAAMEQIAKGFKTQDMPKMGDSWEEWKKQRDAVDVTNAAIRANINLYKSRIDSQRALVAEMEKEVSLNEKLKKPAKETGIDLAFRSEMNRKIYGPKFNRKGYTLDQKYADGDPDKNNFGRDAILKAYAYADEFASIKAKLAEQLKDLQNTLKDMAVSVGLSVAQGIGAGLASGEYDISALKSMLANIAMNIAGSLALIGLPLLAVPGMQGQGLLYLAGAAALSLAAGAIGGGSKGSSGSSSTSTASSAGVAHSTVATSNPSSGFNYNGGTYYSGRSGGGALETRIRGNSLYIIYKTSEMGRRRL